MMNPKLSKNNTEYDNSQIDGNLKMIFDKLDQNKSQFVDQNKSQYVNQNKTQYVD